jgi:hypothetical protein
MTEKAAENGKITLRELFKVDPKDITLKAEPGVDLYRSAEEIKASIQKEARAIRWPWVRDAIAEKAKDFMNLDVVEVLGEAWKKYAEVEKYADRKKYGPEVSVLVPLVEHTVSSKHHPKVEVLVHEVPVGSVEFDLEFSITFDACELKIQDAAIREILPGSARGEASLKLAGVTLLKRESRPLSFPGRIPLGKGIPLRGLGLAAGASGSA